MPNQIFRFIVHNISTLFILFSHCSEVPNLKPVQLRNEEILQRRMGAVTESEYLPVLLYTVLCNVLYRNAEEDIKNQVSFSAINKCIVMLSNAIFQTFNFHNISFVSLQCKHAQMWKTTYNPYKYMHNNVPHYEGGGGGISHIKTQTNKSLVNRLTRSMQQQREKEKRKPSHWIQS